MRNLLKHKNSKEKDKICLILSSKDKILTKDIINTKPIIYTNLKNNSNITINKIKNKEVSIFIAKQFIIYNLIIILISNFFKLNCLKSITSKDSIITLKVCQSGSQKIFNQGTRPDEILIDEQSKSLENSYDLTPNDIVTLKWKYNIIDCSNMFKLCNSIIEMNFSKFDATQCSTFDNMFFDCDSLISLDLSGVITSKNLTSLANMFRGCHALISLNLSTFDTSNVVNFGHLFCDCYSLRWIDVSNLNTEKVELIDNMFNGCKKLTSINISNFNTSKVTFMDYMFKDCESLKIIDFSHLDVTKITNLNNLQNVFLDCNNLEYINLENLKSNVNLE